MGCIGITTRTTPCWRQNEAVDSIINNGRGKAEIWDVNTEDEYHEAVDGRTQSAMEHVAT